MILIFYFCCGNTIWLISFLRRLSFSHYIFLTTLPNIACLQMFGFILGIIFYFVDLCVLGHSLFGLLRPCNVS